MKALEESLILSPRRPMGADENLRGVKRSLTPEQLPHRFEESRNGAARITSTLIKPAEPAATSKDKGAMDTPMSQISHYIIP